MIGGAIVLAAVTGRYVAKALTPGPTLHPSPGEESAN